MTFANEEPPVVQITRFAEDGISLLRVPLFGKRAGGRSFVIEEDVWTKGRAAGWPAAWVLIPEPKAKKEYVMTCTKPLSDGYKALPLARIIMCAKRGEVVRFRDGDTFNLRRINLDKMSREEFCTKSFRQYRPAWVRAPQVIVDEPVDAGAP